MRNEIRHLQDQAYTYLFNAILDNSFQDGVFYSESQLADSLQISRTPIRSALQRLQMDGYIDIFPSRGFMLHCVTKEELREAFQTCIAEESFCSACLSRSPNRFEIYAALRESLERQEALASGCDVEGFCKEDRCFHGLIVDSLHNSTFQLSFTIYRYKIRNFLYSALSLPGAIERSFEEHKALLQAIDSGDFTCILKLLEQHHNDFT